MDPRDIYGDRLYIPKQLSEIQDFINGMPRAAPKFDEVTFYGYPMTIDNEFGRLLIGLMAVRDKLGDDRYRKTVELANAAKALFLADPDSTQGKVSEGVDMLMAIDQLLEEVRGERYHAGIVDFEGILSGD
jgi:hypothetical protein